MYVWSMAYRGMSKKPYIDVYFCITCIYFLKNTIISIIIKCLSSLLQTQFIFFHIDFLVRHLQRRPFELVGEDP